MNDMSELLETVQCDNCLQEYETDLIVVCEVYGNWCEGCHRDHLVSCGLCSYALMETDGRDR